MVGKVQLFVVYCSTCLCENLIENGRELPKGVI